MIMKKALFIISLRYPLINAINIKMHELQDKPADIILDDTIRTDSHQLADNLRKAQIFDKVFFTNPSGYKGLKIFFQNFNINNSFLKACHGSYKNLKLKYLYKTNPLAYLNNLVISGGKIDLSLYDDVYICSQTKISWICLNHLSNNNQISNINLIEEGLSIYTKNDIIHQYSSKYFNQKTIIHLYEPDLIGYNIQLKNISFKKIKKISFNDTILINKVNNIFGYNFNYNFDDKIIFFEQVFEPMPDYYNNKFLRFILYNSYKKHLKEHYFFLDKINIINSLVSVLMNNKLINKFHIKLHPRTKKGITNNLLSYIIGDQSNSHTIPWEVYCMNQKFKNNLWITILSSSVLNRVLCFEEINNIKFIFLYKCTEHFNIKLPAFEKFCINFSNKYNCSIIIPNNLVELEKQILQITSQTGGLTKGYKPMLPASI